MFPSPKAASRLFTLLLLLPFALLPSCGGDDSAGPGGDSVQLPAEWAGAWQFHTVSRECGSETVISDEVHDEILCANGEFIATDEFDFDVSCTGTVTETTLDISCTGTATFEGIVFQYTFTAQATRSGDDVSGTSHLQITSGGSTVECIDEVFTATRTGPAPSPCVATSALRPPRTALLDGTAGR